MQHYFIDQKGIQLGQMVTLSQEDSHHIVRVLRGREGDKLEITSSGERFVAQIEEITVEKMVAVVILERVALEYHDIELPVKVTIACGLSKNDKLDTIVQKATECGMATFIPLALKRDVVQWTAKKSDAKVERLAKIAKGAAEQSHRLHIPTIRPLLTLNELVAQKEEYDLTLIAYEESAKEGDHSVLAQQLEKVVPGQKVLIVFGSEGGLEGNEVRLMEDAGFKACSLGPRILRAETAPIYFLSALSYVLELQKTISTKKEMRK